MKTLLLLAFCFVACHERPVIVLNTMSPIRTDSADPHSWVYFLQHLPESRGDILDFRGKPVPNQAKHFSIINYDVGTRDLQQCADALIRIRAEYLFSQHRFDEIGFHFTNGAYYDWNSYCRGVRPVFAGLNGRQIFQEAGHPLAKTHQSLRQYLNIVFALAGTISLCKELRPADKLDVGTVIIYPGSPGHCCMIIDKKILNQTDTLFKLVEGYMPAQSIYVLANPYEPDLSPWYHLDKTKISTASCIFTSFYLKKFQ